MDLVCTGSYLLKEDHLCLLVQLSFRDFKIREYIREMLLSVLYTGKHVLAFGGPILTY